ncbi:hypothetical protein [Dyadobacter sp. OTU695]|uniref:hypothetical protein n=1 Tax=Dyadobacter sp. OTU695 TaxID=3043860 RepID=UPI00313CD9A8
MTKEITISVPKYVKKFLLSEPDYELLGPDTILAPQKSELGKLIAGFSRMIPYNQNIEPLVLNKTSEALTIRYLCKKKALDVPVERYATLVSFLDEQFRASLIREVSAIHAIHSEPEYAWMVRSFLDRRNVVVSDERDKDMEWDTAKKIYRDHLERINRKNVRNRKLSQPLLSGLGGFCRV